MKKIAHYVGLDVHAEFITVAIAEGGGGEVRALGTIPNRPESIRKLFGKLGSPERVQACYEAGPCGYVLYWQLVEMGIACMVVAPTLIPVRAGDRVKTDRRDAEKLARLLRSGELTAAWVPTREHEALRDLVRARGAAKRDEVRARHRLEKLLLRHGLRVPGKKPGPAARLAWSKTVALDFEAQEVVRLDYINEVEHALQRRERLEKAIGKAVGAAPEETRAIVAALQALRGVAEVTAVALVAEVGSFSRFEHPKQLMGYAGIVSSEHTTGGKVRRGAITKTGNSHLRRVLVEAAWSYRYRANLSPKIRKRQQGLSPEICEVAWKAQHRLHDRYRHLLASGKERPVAVTAVGRELLGFAWDIACRTERHVREKACPGVPRSSLAAVAPANSAGTPAAAPPRQRSGARGGAGAVRRRPAPASL